jgi:TP901 family phage tail tape measure protein
MAGRVIDVTMQLVDKITSPLSSINTKLQDCGKQWQRAGRDIQNTGKAISNVGNTLTTGVTLPIVAAGTAAVNNFANVDKSLRLVQQTMHSTDEEAAILEGALQKAAANSVFGMNDAAEASLNYARAGFTAQQAADMVAPAFDLAAGTATDLGVVTEGLGSVMKLFGADTSEAANYANVFAEAQGMANTTVTDLFESMSNAGSMFATVGWNVKDLSVATGILGDAMISGSEAGNAFKSGLANLTTNDKALSMLEKLQVDVVNADGTFRSFTETQAALHNAFQGLTQEEQVNAATALFGKNQMAKWLTLIQRSPDDIKQMTNALDNVGDTASDMSNALMSGTGGAMESLKSSIDVLSYSMGKFAAQYATPVIQKITQIIDRFMALDDKTKDQIVKWAGIAAAVGPALLVFGKLMGPSGIGGLVTKIGSFALKVKSAGGVLAALATPGNIVVIALLAIGAAIALVVTHWDQIKAAAQTAMQVIQNVVQTAVDAVRGKFEEFGVTFDFFKEKLQPIQDKLNALGMKFQELWQTYAQPSINSLKEAISGAWNFIRPILMMVGEVVKDVFEARIKFAIDTAVLTFKFLFEQITTIVDMILGVFSGYIDFIVGVFTGDWERAWNGVKEIFSSVVSGIQSLWENMINYIVGLIQNIIDKVSWLWDKLTGIGKKTNDEANAAGAMGRNAVGTSYWRGGPTWINERGAEIIDLPKGSRIYPHSESLKMAYNEGAKNGQGRGASSINITIPKLADSISVRSDSDIDAIAAAIANKLERTAQNLGGGELGYIY